MTIIVPVGALESLTDHAPAIKAKVAAGASANQIVAEMEPAALSLLDYVAGLLLPPPFGTAFGIVVWMIEHQKPWTDEERDAWYQRAQGQA